MKMCALFLAWEAWEPLQLALDEGIALLCVTL